MQDSLPQADPRILESPLEASMELADLTGQRLPAIKQRSQMLLLLGVAWSAVVMVMAIISAVYLLDLYLDGALRLTTEATVYISLTLLFVPSMGLGLALLLLTFKERQFLPFLEKASGAMMAIGKDSAEKDEEGASMAGAGAARSLDGILGSAMWAGKLVPTAERMAAVARAVLVVILLGLFYLLALVLLGVFLGTFTILLPAIELAVLAVFPWPAILLFKKLTRDLAFYHYYSRRHRAISEAAAVGPPPVPEGPSALKRFDRYLRSTPAVKALLATPGGGVEDAPDGPEVPYSLLYSGGRDGSRAGILVRLFPDMPDGARLDRFIDEARSLGKKRGIALSRAVALVAADADDIDDSLYEHILDIGRTTMPGECALQMVMEAGGAYSMVPYVADGG